MKQEITNYLNWAGVIAFIVVPPLLVRIFGDAGTIRIIGSCLLAITFIGVSIYWLFKKGSVIAGMPIESQLGERGRMLFDLFIRALSLGLGIAGLSVLATIAPSAVDYSVDHSSVSKQVHVLTHVTAIAFPGASFAHIGIETDDNQYLSFWYPDQTLKVGQRYIFTLLPHSNFVLSAQPY
jgi:hypothetical protein